MRLDEKPISLAERARQFVETASNAVCTVHVAVEGPASSVRLTPGNHGAVVVSEGPDAAGRLAASGADVTVLIDAAKDSFVVDNLSRLWGSLVLGL